MRRLQTIKQPGFPQILNERKSLRGTLGITVSALACLSLLAGPVSAQDTDELAKFSFSLAAYHVKEGKSVEITVVKQGGAEAGVDYETFTGANASGHDATPGLDYEHVSGTLDFPEGDGEQIITIATVSDGVAEEPHPETFAIKLTLPVNEPPIAAFGFTRFAGIVIM